MTLCIRPTKIILLLLVRFHQKSKNKILDSANKPYKYRYYFTSYIRGSTRDASLEAKPKEKLN